jgi:hypothetical protein
MQQPEIHSRALGGGGSGFFYMIPSNRSISNMTAITINVWSASPVGLPIRRPPKKPSSHRMSKITRIVSSIFYSFAVFL